MPWVFLPLVQGRAHVQCLVLLKHLFPIAHHSSSSLALWVPQWAMAGRHLPVEAAAAAAAASWPQLKLPVAMAFSWPDFWLVFVACFLERLVARTRWTGLSLVIERIHRAEQTRDGWGEYFSQHIGYFGFCTLNQSQGSSFSRSSEAKRERTSPPPN